MVVVICGIVVVAVILQLALCDGGGGGLLPKLVEHILNACIVTGAVVVVVGCNIVTCTV